MLPQWWIKNSRFGAMLRRDIGWRLGIGIQFIGIFLLVLGSYYPKAIAIGLTVLLALLIMSVGRGFSSVFSKDIQAHVINNGKGQFLGNVALFSGVITLGFALMLLFSEEVRKLAMVQLSFIVAATFTLLAYIISLGMKVKVDDNVKGITTSIIAEIKQSSLLRQTIIIRCLLLHAMLIMPLLIVMLNDSLNTSIGWLLLAAATSAICSSKLWGRSADRSPANTLIVAALLAALSVVMVVLATELSLSALAIVGFMGLLMAYDGIRLARKVLVLTITCDDNRLSFVGAGNTCVGCFLLLTGAVYGLLYPALQHQLVWLMLGALCCGILLLIMKKRHFVIVEQE